MFGSKKTLDDVYEVLEELVEANRQVHDDLRQQVEFLRDRVDRFVIDDFQTSYDALGELQKEVYKLTEYLEGKDETRRHK